MNITNCSCNKGSEQKSNRQIIIFDTTLRDGEQSPGASMNLPEKLEVAQALVDLGVDIIEAGFPIASPGDHESVQKVAQLVQGATVCGLARCVPADIDCAWDALRFAESPRIHIFLATSAIHRQHKLRMTQDEIIAKAVEGVKRGKQYCSNIEFSPEDASRTEIDFLCRVVEAVINVGATTINIPDTVGYTTPQEMFDRIAALMNRVPNIDQAILSVHCHNDLGMAVANALAGVAAGAGQIECTINGLGERAGNTALEEVVMAMRTRNDIYNVDTKIISQKLVPTSRLVSQITGLKVPRNKAIVGQNAFAHESGIHQDGVLKERTTYEIMSPESVGFTKSDLVLGKHSGRAALADRAKQLGYELTTDQLVAVFTEFKKLADIKKEVFDEDIHSIIEQQIHAKKNALVNSQWKYQSYKLISSGGKEKSTFQLSLLRNGQVESLEWTDGCGPIDLAFSVVQKMVGLPIKLKEFKVEAVSTGQDAQGEVVVLIEDQRKPGSSFRGRGVSIDTIEATIIAILSAIDRIDL